MESSRGRLHLLCTHCSPARFLDDVNALSTHILSHHGFMSTYRCGSCKRTYGHKNSLIRHIKETHERALSPSSHASASSSYTAHPSPVDPSSENPTPIPALDQSSQDAAMFEGQGEDFNVSDNLKSSAARFLLDLRSSGNITGSSISKIQDYTLKLIKVILSDVKSKTEQFLIKKDILGEEADVFLNETFNVCDPLDYFSSQYGLAKPEEKFLDYRIENRLDRKLRLFIPTQVPETFQYVSLISTLTMVVQNDYLRDLILSEKSSNDGVMRSYRDGNDFKNDQFLMKYPDAIRLNLYQDDLETSSALGSKDGIHKLGCFYVSIQNLPPEERALLSSIFLLALTYAEDLKKEGTLQKVLVNVGEDLKHLKSDAGVKVQLTGGQTFILRACIPNLSADTLAAHMMLGLMSPSANLFCRCCLITKKDFAKDSNAVGIPRTSQEHARHIKEVKQNPSLAPVYGVKEETYLSSIMRVPEDSSLDLFHDLVGVIQMLLKLVCHEFIVVKKLVSVYDFNTNIYMFVYGTPDIKNKPSPNFSYEQLRSKGHSLKQSASQTFCLLRIFPFLIDGIDENDKRLQLVFLLQDILKILFSLEIPEAQIDRLGRLIYDHNKLFHEVFVQPCDSEPSQASQQDDSEGEADQDLSCEESECVNEQEEAAASRQRRSIVKSKTLKKGINKLHHLTHYPDQCRSKGPVLLLWCALFEIRHRLLRKFSAVIQNFKNIPKSMAQVFQLSTLGAVLDRTGPKEDKPLSSDSEECTVASSLYAAQLLEKGFQEHEQIRIVKAAQLSCEEYRVGLFVALRSEECALPTFAVIVDCLFGVEGSKTFLVVEKCKNEGLSARYNSYKVCFEEDAIPILVTVKELANYHPMAPWSPVKKDGSVGMYLHPRSLLL